MAVGSPLTGIHLALTFPIAALTLAALTVLLTRNGTPPAVNARKAS
ncbi:hypothetical protein ACFQHO_23710 [Actinomadura yumaensis]